MTLEQKIKFRVLDLILDAHIASRVWARHTRNTKDNGQVPYEVAALLFIDHTADKLGVLRITPNDPKREHLV